MENNNEITSLINSFKQYRDLLTPIEESLREFSVSYENISDEIKKLNTAFGGDIQEKLDGIYKDLNSQAEKSKGLANEIDRFSNSTKNYVQQIDKLVRFCESLENRLSVVDDIQKKAESQIEKLNGIIEEKKKTYDLKQLEKNLETYNIKVQEVSEFINKDVAEVLSNNTQKLEEIKDKNESVLENINNDNKGVDTLIDTYKATNNLLKKIVEKEAVNEEYIFTILDKWAEDRKVKIKK